MFDIQTNLFEFVVWARWRKTNQINMSVKSMLTGWTEFESLTPVTAPMG